MEHWSKTSLSEPQPLGRHKRREREGHAGASRAGSGKFLKLLNVYPASQKVTGDFSGGEARPLAGKPKRREREEDDAGAFHGGSGKSVKKTNVSPARPENGGFRSSGVEEMTPWSSASRRVSTNAQRDWPSRTGPIVDHRPRNVSALSPPREGMVRKGLGQESISKSGKASISLVKKTENSTSMVTIGMRSNSSAKIGTVSTKCQQTVGNAKASEPRMVKDEKIGTGSTSSMKTMKGSTSLVEIEKARKEAKRRELEKNAMASRPRTKWQQQGSIKASEPRNGDRKTEMMEAEWIQARKTVMTVLKSYRDHCKDLEKDKSKLDLMRVDLVSCEMVKIEFPHLLEKKAFIGTVPGIEVGDRFMYRTELRLARMHGPLQCGIDTTVDARKNKIAISIVDSGGYDNYMSSSETLVYCAQGSSAENQREKPVNLAMMKSRELKSPVRVIKTRKVHTSTVYFYDGLYTVEDMWEDRKFDGKMLKFKLVRIPGQPSSLANRKLSS